MASIKTILSLCLRPTIKIEDITIITDKSKQTTDAIRPSGIASFINIENTSENITTLNTGNNTV